MHLTDSFKRYFQLIALMRTEKYAPENHTVALVYLLAFGSLFCFWLFFKHYPDSLFLIIYGYLLGLLSLVMRREIVYHLYFNEISNYYPLPEKIQKGLNVTLADPGIHRFKFLGTFTVLGFFSWVIKSFCEIIL